LYPTTTAQIKHVGFTLPSPMEREFHQIATEEHRTKSELFREMFKGNYSLDSHGALPNHDFLATQSRQNLYG
jgi:hypothetical protein